MKSGELMDCLENRVAPFYWLLWRLLTSLRADRSVGPMTSLETGISADTQGLDSSRTAWLGLSGLLTLQERLQESSSLLFPAPETLHNLFHG